MNRSGLCPDIEMGNRIYWLASPEGEQREPRGRFNSPDESWEADICETSCWGPDLGLHKKRVSGSGMTGGTNAFSRAKSKHND
jgi:hypothetical protein